MICDYCGKQIPNDYTKKFCPHCFAEFAGELPYTAMQKENVKVKSEKKGEK